MIRPRSNSPYHQYDNLFQDMRDGRLSQADYATMVAEDLEEVHRRQAYVKYLRAEAIVALEDGTYDARTKIKDEPSGAY